MTAFRRLPDISTTLLHLISTLTTETRAATILRRVVPLFFFPPFPFVHVTTMISCSLLSFLIAAACLNVFLFQASMYAHIGGAKHTHTHIHTYTS